MRTLRIGVAGLGRAFTVMLPTFVRDSRVVLVAAADPRAEARTRFAKDFSAQIYATVEELCADPAVEIVYVATPHQHHARHAALAAQHGKHLLVEKPMALTLNDCAAMIEAAKLADVQLIVGHSHSFDAPILRTRELIARGDYGAVRMMAAFNYTDFLYRPRRPEELDTAQGGGAVFNQAAHQVDIVRLLGGGLVKTVRAATGAWDAARPTEGAYAALLTFENGAFASLTYGGYGHFDSDEFAGWIGEMGQAKRPYVRKPQHFANAAEETAFKNARNYGGAAYQPPAEEQLSHQHFGTVIVSCERAELRAMPNGVLIYQDGAARLDPLLPPRVPRAEVIDELYAAVAEGIPPRHDGAWAMATLEVCHAILQSAREGRDIALRHQVAIAVIPAERSERPDP
ncbi:MAG: Gfo/Idh/MocA family oxidoreductase [Alphaproteobacteria bacterium]|nr:MAG: Gfo/Idh/MocA family oxidoreductase [Alphaproteobacteria bacterium]